MVELNRRFLFIFVAILDPENGETRGLSDRCFGKKLIHQTNISINLSRVFERRYN